jgi:hypothetical protein
MLPLNEKFNNHFSSFSIGNVYFLMLNIDFIVDNELNNYYLNLIEEELIKIYNKYTWKIVLSHRPFYCSDKILSRDCSTTYF